MRSTRVPPLVRDRSDVPTFDAGGSRNVSLGHADLAIETGLTTSFHRGKVVVYHDRPPAHFARSSIAEKHEVRKSLFRLVTGTDPSSL